MGRHFISDRRTEDPPPTSFFDKRSDFVDYPSEARLPVAFPQGRGEIEAYPFISDRRTKEHNTPSLREGWGGLHITPNPYPREGSVDGWGKYGLRSSLLAFKTKWRKKGQKQVSPRQHLGDSSQSSFAQNGQKNYYSAHSLCHSVVVGCNSFAPFGGVSLRHPIPRALPGADISMPHSGRKPDTHPQPHSRAKLAYP